MSIRWVLKTRRSEDRSAGPLVALVDTSFRFDMRKRHRSVLLMAFDRGVDGVVKHAFDPRHFEREDSARRAASRMLFLYEGIVVLRYRLDPSNGDLADRKIVFASGFLANQDTHPAVNDYLVSILKTSAS